MPALFFPSLNALRLALVSGLVPPELTRSPAAAGFDAHGRLWLEPAELPPRESLAALARIGVQALGDAGVATAPIGCWAELLPLGPSREVAAGPVLFLVPEKRLARFVARLHRSGGDRIGVSLPDATPRGFGWVTVASPPADVLLEATEPDSPAEVFAEQVPGVWVRHGWRHAAPEQLTRATGEVLFARPPRAVDRVRAVVPACDPDEFPLTGPAQQQGVSPPPPPIPVRVKLAPRTDHPPETVWVLDAAGERDFRAFCTSADERVLRRLEVAHVGTGSETRLAVRATGKPNTLVLPLAVTGFAADPRVPGLYVPANQSLRPQLRVRELADALGVGPGVLVWVEPGPAGEAVPHALPVAAFRPVADLIEYHTPPATPLGVERRADPFPLSRFAVVSDVVVAHGDDPDELRDADPHGFPNDAGPPPGEPGWLRRSIRKLVARLRPPRGEAPPEPSRPPASERPEPQAAPVTRVREQKLASPDALLHGQDWAVRRRELENRLFCDLPRLGPAGRAERWADLAAVYTATGNAVDAAVCWTNAVWEASAPPGQWLEQWFAAECRAAKLHDTAGGVDRWLSEPGRPGVGRVIAAYTAVVGFSPAPVPGVLELLPRLLAFLDHQFDDVPVRGVWLAHLAAARACDGDALGLARWRDRVLARLAERGPGLDLDEPSFLRFHGTASADRFQAAREWLVRVREPVLGWVQRQGGGKLRWAGLDAETDCTGAYAQFMLAWGLGCLGERTRAKDWAARARKAVTRATGPGVDTAAHAVLGDMFLLRVRDAQEGRVAKPGLPHDLRSRLEGLSELARFSVDRLREHSRILEPLDRVHAFRGLDLKTFWGTDRLGERLFVLTGRADRDRLAGETDDLLRLCHEHPATDTVPRVVLTLLDLAPWLDPAVLPDLLDLVPVALDWSEAWVAAGKWSEAERPDRVLRYQTRTLTAAFAALAGLLPSDAAAANPLVRRLIACGERSRLPLLGSSRQAFRALHKLGLAGAAESLVRFLDPAETASGADPVGLGVACGWLVAGNEDAGGRILDQTREALYLDAGQGTRARTSLAVAYAEALGFAPARIAHGRLEELFQRLGPIDAMGSTNRYFTLRPLQLIDAVVRSVVTDEFALGPSVRGWLDDDEFLIRGRIHRDLAAVLREQDLA